MDIVYADVRLELRLSGTRVVCGTGEEFHHPDRCRERDSSFGVVDGKEGFVKVGGRKRSLEVVKKVAVRVSRILAQRLT
jgi:hypothetical protein